jgi:hypothetical protein
MSEASRAGTAAMKPAGEAAKAKPAKRRKKPA